MVITFLKRIKKTLKEKTLTILIGLPGIGKSTLAQNLIDKVCDKRIIISSDEIRFKELNYEKTGIDFDSLVESKVWGSLHKNVEDILKESQYQDCIIDATNVRRAQRKKFIQLAKNYNYKTVAIVLYAPYDEILKRNNSRNRKVAEEVIYRFYKKFQKPTKREFDKVYTYGSSKAFYKLKKKIKKKEEKEKLKINGNDIMEILNIESGKEVGMILKYLNEKVLLNEIPNRRKALLKTCLEKFGKKLIND
ncbi:MAG: AAA family ATPase [Candidatus Lokiarchaeota archaeon]|nr:AAA family ATPase [Candidatus Lokiarchaeota archaeon]